MKIGKTVLSGMAMLFLIATAQAGVADRIVAIVNSEVVTQSELNKAFEPFQKNIEASVRPADRERALDENRTIFLDRMVDNLLIEQEARKAGINVLDEEVAAAISDVQKTRGMTPEGLQKALADEGISLDAYRKDIRDQIMRIRVVRRDIKSRVAVTDEEIGEYYRSHRDDYEGKESVRIRQIFLSLPKGSDPAGKEKVRESAESIRKRIVDGESFESLSEKYSKGPTAASGGDIGYIERGVVLPEVEAVAFSLPLNQVSGVIEAGGGFHIIQVIDRRGAGLTAIESVREEIRGKIEQDKLEKKYKEWIAELRKKSHIEIKL
jgi:parvulin-like peptidyl-prolyl isomerase